MGYVVNRTTGEYLQSVNEPDYDPGDWLINPDLSPVSGVPERHWKVETDAVAEMTDAEKAVIDKPIRRAEIDAKTSELIGEGVVEDAKTISLSQEAQTNWVSLHIAASGLSYPYELMSLDDKGVVSFADVAALQAFCVKAIVVTQGHRDTGKDLKKSVNAATTIAELDLVVDNR